MQSEPVRQNENTSGVRVKWYFQVLIFLAIIIPCTMFVFDTPFVRHHTIAPNNSSAVDSFEFFNTAAEGWREAQLDITLQCPGIKLSEEASFEFKLQAEDLFSKKTVIISELEAFKDEFDRHLSLQLSTYSNPKLKAILSKEGNKRITVIWADDENSRMKSHVKSTQLDVSFFYESVLRHFLKRWFSPSSYTKNKAANN